MAKEEMELEELITKAEKLMLNSSRQRANDLGITLQEYLSLRLLVKLEFDIKSDIREQCHTLKRISGLSELIYKEI